MSDLYKCTKEIHDKCQNNSLCHLCDGESLYRNDKEAKEERRKVYQEQQAEEDKYFKVHKKEKKEGMGFEKRVAGKWNSFMGGNTKKKKVAKPRLDALFDEEPEEEVKPKVPNHSLIPSKLPTQIPKKTTVVGRGSKNEAKRQANSGAMWYAKGDITLDFALMECKERGSKNARGEKQITIPKLWLDKQEAEANQEGKNFWYLPFGYKNSDEIYLIKPFDHELEFVAELRRLQAENESLQQQLKEAQQAKEGEK